MCCILVAAKYEEPEEYIPLTLDLNECSNDAYNQELIQQMELIVLQKLDWHLKTSTVMHFVKCYNSLNGGVFEGDMCNGRPLNDKIIFRMRKYSDFFADLTVPDYDYVQYPQSHLAAACIVAARNSLRITPEWPSELQSMTGITSTEFKECASRLMSAWDENGFMKLNVDEQDSPRDVLVQSSSHGVEELEDME